MRALDGDSLLLADGQQVRLLGVNAPEFGKDGRPDQPLAREARAVAERLAAGRTVSLRLDREQRDRYGRLLAYVALTDGHELQEELLLQGLAWAIAMPPNLARQEAYAELERQARAAGRGIWGDGRYRPIPAERLRRQDTGFCLIEGTVHGVRLTAHSVLLILAPHVSIAIPREYWHYFGGSPTVFENRRLVARGWLTEYKNSLRMRISHPAMIEPAR